jgi:hypothetical protein
LLAEKQALCLNGRDLFDRGRDFSDLDAMVEQLWRGTESGAV